MHPAEEYTAVETYNHLLPEEMGQKKFKTEAEIQKAEHMRDFLRIHFGTDKVQNVDIELLKEKLEGPSLLNRIAYRKSAGKALTGKREAIKKGQVLRRENLQASSMESHIKNPLIGFPCLNYSVSEGAGYLLAKVQYKKGKSSGFRCGVRTVDGEAKAPGDYEHVEQVLEFDTSDVSEVKIKIKDDDEWEPDKDFYIELFDLETGARL